MLRRAAGPTKNSTQCSLADAYSYISQGRRAAGRGGREAELTAFCLFVLTRASQTNSESSETGLLSSEASFHLETLHYSAPGHGSDPSSLQPAGQLASQRPTSGRSGRLPS